MSKFMKILAIVVLLVTIAGAGVVLYGLNTLSPQVVQTSVAATPAADAENTFDSLVSQLEKQGLFSCGVDFAGIDGGGAERRVDSAG